MFIIIIVSHPHLQVQNNKLHNEVLTTLLLIFEEPEPQMQELAGAGKWIECLVSCGRRKIGRGGRRDYKHLMSGYLEVKASVYAALQWSYEGRIHGHSKISGLEGGSQLLLLRRETLVTQSTQMTAWTRM
jgi:hypothetical protein